MIHISHGKLARPLQLYGKNFKNIATAVGGFKNALDCRQFYNKNRRRPELHPLDEKHVSCGSKDLNGRASTNIEQSVKKEDDGSVMKSGVSNPDDNSSRIASSSLREKTAFQEKQSAMPTSAIPVNEENPLEQYSSILKSGTRIQ